MTRTMEKVTEDTVRRVSLVKAGQSVATQSEYHFNDPNGTHYLVPVDEYVPVKREVWERVNEFPLDAIDRQKETIKIMRERGLAIEDLDDPMQKLAFTMYSFLVGMSSSADMYLAEIETLDESLTDRQSFGLTQEVEDE